MKSNLPINDSVSVKERKVGRPPYHPKVVNVELGTEHDTYESAAKEIKGYRNKVYMVCQGMQKHHHGFHFKFKDE